MDTISEQSNLHCIDTIPKTIQKPVPEKTSIQAARQNAPTSSHIASGVQLTGKDQNHVVERRLHAQTQSLAANNSARPSDVPSAKRLDDQSLAAPSPNQRPLDHLYVDNEKVLEPILPIISSTYILSKVTTIRYYLCGSFGLRTIG